MKQNETDAVARFRSISSDFLSAIVLCVGLAFGYSRVAIIVGPPLRVKTKNYSLPSPLW